MNHRNFSFLSLILLIFIFNSCGGPPNDYKLITKENIPYLSDPWNDFLGVKDGEVIGIVLPISKKLDYREVFFKHYESSYFRTKDASYIEVPFNYVARNCDIGKNRKGELDFVLIDKKIPDNLLGKECLIIGTVVSQVVISPKHACDKTHASIELDDVYIEQFNPTNPPIPKESNTSNKCLIGPEFKSPSDIYGGYCYIYGNYDDMSGTTTDCSEFCYFGDIKDFEKDFDKPPKNVIKYSKSKDWDGYVYKLGDAFDCYGFWKVIKYSPIVQNDNMPNYSAGELFNGVELSIEWVKNERNGLGCGIDAIYQIRNSPKGIEYYGDDNKEEYWVILRNPRSIGFRYRKEKGQMK